MNALLTFIERLQLTTKLLIGFSAGILIAVAIGLNALSSVSALEAEMEKMYSPSRFATLQPKTSYHQSVYIGI